MLQTDATFRCIVCNTTNELTDSSQNQAIHRARHALALYTEAVELDIAFGTHGDQGIGKSCRGRMH